jgi:hypothetical protein
MNGPLDGIALFVEQKNDGIQSIPQHVSDLLHCQHGGPIANEYNETASG